MRKVGRIGHWIRFALHRFFFPLGTKENAFVAYGLDVRSIQASFHDRKSITGRTGRDCTFRLADADEIFVRSTMQDLSAREYATSKTRNRRPQRR